MAENTYKRPFLLAGKKRRKIITIALCLFVTTVFWFFNALNNDYSTVIKYPVKLVFDANDYTVERHSDKYVKLSATGYGWYLLYYSLGFGITPINVSLHQFVDKKYISDDKLLELAKIQLQNIEINRVVSDTFKIEAQTKERKKFFLKLDKQSLHIPKGKSIENIVVEPAYLTCTGPKNELIALPDYISFALPDTFIEKDFNALVPIYYHPSKNIKQDIANVKVSFRLK
ncbi:MAG: hypothetical protein ACKVOU_08050 [Cytophagales bacterium]